MRTVTETHIQYCVGLDAGVCTLAHAQGSCASDAAIIFATVGDLVPLTLQAVRKGGRVLCAHIHLSDIPPSSTPTAVSC